MAGSVTLRNAHVLVTGASRGIGASIALEFANRGATLSVLARSTDALEAVAAEVGGTAYPLDLADREQVSTVIAKVEAGGGPVDVLVNNAATAPVGRLVDEAPEDLARMYEINVISPIELCRQVLPGMLARGRGAIVNISSLAGITAFPTLAAYGASKAALGHFTAAMQRELRHTPVRMTIAQLGEVAGTDMMEKARTSPTVAAMSRRLARTRLLPEVLPEDVARAVARAVEKGSRHCVVPRRVTPLQLIRELPSRMNDGILVGLR
jgi:short-subunit dehydrogenase